MYFLILKQKRLSRLYIRPRRDLNILQYRKSVMWQEFPGVDGVALTFAVCVSLLGLIHPAVGFPARVKGCITPLEKVLTCFMLAAIFVLS